MKLFLALSAILGVSFGLEILQYKPQVQEMIKEYNTKVPTVGKLPEINGPCKKDRIAVIGAGPAGIHLAYLLKKNGFNDVTILEKTNRVGGNLYNVDYNGVSNPLADEFINTLEETEMIKLWKSFNMFETYPYNPAYRAENTPDSQVSTFGDMMEAMGADEFIAQTKAYIKLHKDLVGSYDGILFPRPDDAVFANLQGSFADFLNDNGLGLVADAFEIIYPTHGINPTSRMGAAEGLISMKPTYLIGLVGGLTRVAANPGGFQRFFEKLIEDQDVAVRTNFDVQFIDQEDDGAITLTSEYGDVETYDFVAFSGFLYEYASRASFGDDYILNLMASQTSNACASSLVDMKGDTRAATTEGYIAGLSDWVNGQAVSISTDYYAELNGISGKAYQTRDYQINGQPASKRTIMVHQYGSNEYTPSESELRSAIREHYSALGATDIEILKTYPMRMDPQWDIDTTATGPHWDIWEAQGSDNVWWIGNGVTGCDLANAVILYNQQLLQNSAQC